MSHISDLDLLLSDKKFLRKADQSAGAVRGEGIQRIVRVVEQSDQAIRVEAINAIRSVAKVNVSVVGSVVGTCLRNNFPTDLTSLESVIEFIKLFLRQDRRFSDRLVGRLIRSLDRGDYAARRQAVSTLYRVGKESPPPLPEYIDELVTAMYDDKGYIRKYIAKSIGYFGVKHPEQLKGRLKPPIAVTSDNRPPVPRWSDTISRINSRSQKP